jgi:hypothetical protein
MIKRNINRPTVLREVDQSLDWEASAPVAEEQEMSVADATRLINELLSQVDTSYNAISDQELPTENNSIPYNKESVRALRNSNRFRALEQRDRIESYRQQYINVIRSSPYSVTYDVNVYPYLPQLLQYSPDYAGPGIMTSGDYLWAKEVENSLAIRESNGFVAIRSTTVARSEYDFGFTEGVTVPDNINNEWVASGIGLFEDSSMNARSSNDINNASRGYVAGFESIMDARRSNDIVIGTLGYVDRDNDYISTIFGRSTIDVSVMDRPESFTIDEILENCFDCFLEAWNGDVDFVLGLQVELRLRELLDTIDFLLDKIAQALDIPAMIRANLCSLLRLGVLCPIEIAFLIASFIGLVRFLITEVILNFKGFLFNLLAAILDPLLNALALSARFAISPFNIYAGCVFNSIIDAQQAEQTISQLRFTTSQIQDLLQSNNNEVSNRINGLSRERAEALIGRRLEGNEEPSNAVRSFFRNNMNPREINALIFSPRIQQVDARDALNLLGNIDFLDFLNSPNLMAARDPLDFIKTILAENSKRFNEIFAWIENGLNGLRQFIRQNSVSRLEIAAKIIALSQIISLLVVLYRLIAGDVDVCKTERNEDGSLSFIPQMTPEELFPSLPLNDMYQYVPPGSRIINGNIVVEPSDGYIYNPTTNNSFPILRCETGKAPILSNTELLQLLQQLS